LINGAIMFTADLMREIDNPVRLDSIRILAMARRRSRRRSAGHRQAHMLDIKNRHVLIVDDILDTRENAHARREFSSGR